jgi:hypothetical protein
MGQDKMVARRKEQPERLLAGLVEALRNLTYAGIGIVGAVGEEAEATYRRSIHRGQGRVRRVEERLGLRKPGATVDGAPSALAKAAGDDVKAALARLNLADPADLEALRRQLAELEAKVDQLTAQ